MTFLRRSLVLLCCLAGGARLAHARADIPQVRVAVVVGNNTGNNPTRALKYAETEVARLSGLLDRSGGFQVLLLQAPTRAQVEQALTTARERIATARAAGSPTMFL